MSSPAVLLRSARLASGLTQEQLAVRAGVTQPTIAALERPGSNPRIGTLARILDLTGHRLQLIAPVAGPSVDESLIREHLRRPMADRIRGIEPLHEEALKLSGSIRRARVS